MDMKNLAKWRFMLLSELWDWSVLCHISIFHFSFGCRQIFFCMCWFVIVFLLSNAVCSISCTLIKMWILSQEGQGSRIPTPSFLPLMFMWKTQQTKKKATEKFLTPSKHWRLWIEQNIEHRCSFKTKNKEEVRSKLHIYQIKDWESTMRKTWSALHVKSK